MESKLTLRLDHDLVESAKVEARKRGTSVSKMVAAYFRALDRSSSDNLGVLPPVTSSLLGTLRGALVDREDYRKHIEEKHR